MSSRDDDANANLGPQMVVTNWALDAACGLFLALRIYCKLSRKRVLWWDDYFLIASWVSCSFSSFFQYNTYHTQTRPPHRWSDQTRPHHTMPTSDRPGPSLPPPILTSSPPLRSRLDPVHDRANF